MARRETDVVLYVTVDRAEAEGLRRIVRRDRVSVPQFVRRCINRHLIELDEDLAILEVRHTGRPGKRGGRARKVAA